MNFTPFNTVDGTTVLIQPEHVTALAVMKFGREPGARIFTGTQYFDVRLTVDQVLAELRVDF